LFEDAVLECGEQVVARDALLRGHALERVAELLLADAVHALDLLLFIAQCLAYSESFLRRAVA
jgi:hypothetical protein